MIQSLTHKAWHYPKNFLINKIDHIIRLNTVNNHSLTVNPVPLILHQTQLLEACLLFLLWSPDSMAKTQKRDKLSRIWFVILQYAF